MIYLDYAATTPIDEEVLNAYIKTSNNFFANTSSLHKLGRESNYMYELAIKDIQNTLKTDHEIIFTSNATEANNLGIMGIVSKYNDGKIITTSFEHPSVYNVMKQLENNYEVVYLDMNEDGLIDLNQLKHEMTKETILVSIMWVNNIIGTIQPIEKIIEIMKDYPRAKLHVDVVQGLCKIEPKFNFNDIDLFTFSTHKIYGPKGIGGLFLKKGIDLKKQLFGSSVQFGIKPGTFDLSLIVATAKALKKFYPLANTNHEYVKKLWEYLYDNLNKNPKIVINTPMNNITNYVLNFSFPNEIIRNVVNVLELDDIYISTGSACSSKSNKPERTVLALTKDEKRAVTSVRISLSHKTNINELKTVVNCLEKI